MLNRRQFMTRLCGSSVGAAAMLSGTASMTSHAANTAGYRALVCVFLYGGLDSHDVLVLVMARAQPWPRAIRHR